MRRHLTLTLLGLLIFSTVLFAQPCNVSGTLRIGPTGNYLTLTAALNGLRTSGMGGAVILELQANYTSLGETFPIAFGNIPCASATNTITVRPAVGAVNLSINSNFNGTTISLDNARYVTFDGRPGSTGTTPQLTIRNATPGGAIYSGGTVFVFSNDASFNTLQYLNIKGEGYDGVYEPDQGLISFLGSTNSITNGNNNNLVSNCVIGDVSQFYWTGIFSKGDASKKNRNNKIENCQLFNHSSPESPGSGFGIYLGMNSEAWEVAGNSFYETIDYKLSGFQIAIAVRDSTSSGFWIHDNFFGGTAPRCGGTKLICRGGVTGVSIVAGNTGYSTVENNTISNIEWHSYSNSSGFFGIELIKGKVNCGGAQGNTIGSMTQQSSIVAISEYFAQETMACIAINNTPYYAQNYLDSFFIKNNKIGGISVQRGPSNYLPTTFIGIAADLVKSYGLISNNILGSTIVENSIESVTDYLYGIKVDINPKFGSGVNLLPVDIIANQGNHWKGATVFISLAGGTPLVKDNIFRNSTGQNTSLTGIFASNCRPGTLVSGNSIYALQTLGTAQTLIGGISIESSYGVSIYQNNIHNFHNETPSGIFKGINVIPQSNGYGGDHKIFNNFVSLGPDTIAAKAGAYTALQGITVSTDNSIVANNSVYLGGSGGTGGEPSYALQLNDEQRIPQGKTRVFNNIFQNSRAGTSYIFPLIEIDYTLLDTSRFFLNNNLYYYTGSQTKLGQFRGNDYYTVRQWSSYLKLDSNSIFGSPNFANPEGNSNGANLHLLNPTPAEGQGLPVDFVTTDFDKELRVNLTPVDIGADAGNFSFVDVDTPTLAHNTYSYVTSDAVFSFKVNIADNGTGIDTAGANKPRMWFRKTYPVASGWLSVPGILTSGTMKNGQWTFSPDFKAAGLTLNAADSIAFYFVAQDKSSPVKVGYSGNDITRHSTVNTQITAPLIPNRLYVYGQFNDTVFVGNGQLYTSLSGVNGFFQAAKTMQFNPNKKDVYVVITSNLQEDEYYGFSTPPSTSQTIHFITNTPEVKQIQNRTYLGPMLTFNNVANISIDGSVNGSGSFLQFINASPNNPPGINSTIYILGAANRIYIENCLFNSNLQSSSGMVAIKSQVIEKFVVRNNKFSSATGFNGNPYVHIYTNTSNSDSILITGNDFANFNQYAISMEGGGGNIPAYGKIIINNNHFYQESIITASSTTAINIPYSKSSLLVSNNYIGGAARNCVGVWQQFGYGPTVEAIYLGADNVVDIQNNTIRNIKIRGSFAGILNGIHLADFRAGSSNINSNIIGGGIADTSVYAQSVFTGILCSSKGTKVQLDNNEISKVFTGMFKGIDCTSKNGTIKSNKISACFSAINSDATIPSFTGIKASLDTGLIETNEVHHLYKKLDVVSDCIGIDAIWQNNNGEVVIARNKISALQSLSGEVLAGIRIGKGWFHVHNNQVNLANDSIPNDVSLRGIYINGSGAYSKLVRVHYNTVRLFGNSSTTTKSYGVFIDGGSPITSFKNNFLYNQRSGYGINLALGMTAVENIWNTAGTGNNLYVTADTSYMNEWRTSGPVSGTVWQTLSSSDGNSSFNSVNRIPIDSIFVSALSNNLHINNISSYSWYVNDKGQAIADVGGDIDLASGARSTDTVNGKTDIGADEFTSNATLPATPISFCSGGTQTIASGINTASYQWQINTGSGFLNLNDNISYSGTNTANLTLKNILSSWYGYQFRCIAGSSITSPIKIEIVNRWVGSINLDWSNPGNWSCNIVPDGNTDVVILNGTVEITNNAICRSITIRPTASFVVKNNAILTITH